MNKIIKIGPHVLFWVLSFLICYNLLTVHYNNGALDVIYTALLLNAPLVVFYFGYWAAATFLNKRKYTSFTIILFLILIVGIGIHYLAFSKFADLLFPQYYFVNLFSLLEISQLCALFMLFGILFFIGSSWISLKERQAFLEEENHRVQLASLKSQINPHFLFNSLNNIYSLIHSSNARARDYLIKLTDSLRYMLYDTDEALVPLDKEVDYLYNYIELEKLRFEANSTISYESYGKFDGYLISPLILIAIVENCFKHVNKKNALIEISLSIEDGHFQLSATNSLEIAKIFDNKGGIGLKNLRKRLKMIYPSKHNLDITEDNNRFSANLTIDLNL